MADTSLQTLQMLDPQYDAAAIAKLQHQKLIGDLLLQQSQQANQGGMAGNVYVGPSWTQGLAKMLQMYQGNKMGTEADTGLMNAQAQSLARALGGGQSSTPPGVTGTYQAPDGTVIGSTGNQSVPMPQNTPGNTIGGLSKQDLRDGLVAGLFGDHAAGTFWKNRELTPTVKDWNAQGINPTTMAPYTIGAAQKGATQSFTPGQLNILPNGQPVIAPNFETGVQGTIGPNGAVASPIPGAAGIKQGMANAETLGKTQGTLVSGYDENGQPAYSLGVPPGTVGAPPQAPVPGVTSPGTWNPSSAGPNGQPVAPQQSDRTAILNQELQRESANLAADQSKGDAEGVRIAQSNIAGIQREVNATRPPSQPGVITPGPKLGTVAGADAAQGELSKKWTDLNAANAQAQTSTSYLQNMRQLASKANTGQLSDKLAYTNGLLAASGLSQRATDAKTANDLLDKYSAQIVSRLSAGGGMGTDAARSILQAAYPGRHMSEQAINEAADNLVGANEMIKAKASILSPHAAARDPVAYQQKEVIFDQNADPRIWQYKNITDPTQRKLFAAAVIKQDPQFPAKIKALEGIGALK